MCDQSMSQLQGAALTTLQTKQVVVDPLVLHWMGTHTKKYNKFYANAIS